MNSQPEQRNAETAPSQMLEQHPETISAKFVFLDVVGFSTRVIELQAAIVARLNACVAFAIVFVLGSKAKASYIPTGDGLCIWIDDKAIQDIPGVESYDVDVRIALAVLDKLRKRSPQEVDFSVRIGINENEDIAVTDINGGKNIAGRGINFAARVMDQADASQILMSARVHDRLCQRARYADCFRSHRVVFKHGIEETVYQLTNINDPSVDVSTLETGEPKEVKRQRQLRESGRQLVTEGLRMDAFRECLCNASATVLIVTHSRDWIYQLAPTLVLARSRGVRMLVSYYPNSQEDTSRGEVRYLNAIGAVVVEHRPEDKAPFSGFLADFHSNTRICGVVQTVNNAQTPVFAQRLESSADEELLLCLREAALSRFQRRTQGTELNARLMQSSPLGVALGTDDEALDLMKRVKFYRNRNCTFEFASMPVREIVPQAEDIRMFKLRQARSLIRAIEKLSGGELFSLLKVELTNGQICPILPPVVELHGARYIVAEGHNRFFALHTRDIHSKAKVIVVSGDLPAPATAMRQWTSLREDDERVGTAMPAERSMRNESRCIEGDVHQGLWPATPHSQPCDIQEAALAGALGDLLARSAASSCTT